jgi:spore coat polysaccharide biosynthesis protein SpsF|tara:strand:- start:773 stop:1597 length:825 start_codon:yes stop_codon:yes gene_type:complete
MGSTRLPGKVILDLNGKSVFSHQVERMRQCVRAECPYLATSKDEKNKPLIAEAIKENMPYYAGAEEDLSERFISIMELENADAAVRCAGDQPLFSYEIVDLLLSEYKGEDYLYPSTKLGNGIGLEIFSLKALKKTREYYRGPALSKYILEYPHNFDIRGIDVSDEFSRPEFRLTLDTIEDYRLINLIYERFYDIGKPVNLRQVYKYLDDNPDIANINRDVVESPINTYVTDLLEKPVFTILRDPSGKYFVKNRMSEIVSVNEFKKFYKNISWDE